MTIRYPWPAYRAPLRCDLDEVGIDGVPVAADVVDRENLRVRLDGVSAWERFECGVTVTTDEPPPPGVDEVVTYVLVSCVGANTRVPFRLGDVGGGTSTGSVHVAQSAVTGSFALQAQAAANIAGRWRTVGASDPWTAVLERHEAPVPPGAPPFEIVWRDFAGADAPLGARENSSAHAFMELASGPRLLLNAGIEGLRALLHNNAARLERRRVRDLLSTSVARYAAATLFRAAVAEIVAYDDGPPQPPTTALYRQVFEAVANLMPGVGDVDQLYERLVAAGDDRISDTELWARIDVTIDALTGYAEALTTASREVAHG